MDEAARLQQRGNSWKISKSLEKSIRGNEAITNSAVVIPRAVKTKTKRFGVNHRSLMNEGTDKHPKHQSSRARLLNWIRLMRSERRMMSPHQSLVPPRFFCRFMFLRLEKRWPQIHCRHCATDTQTAAVRGPGGVCLHSAGGLTIRERWGAFSNVSSKCQLKITRVLGKVGSAHADMFSILTQQCLSDWAAGWHDGVSILSVP